MKVMRVYPAKPADVYLYATCLEDLVDPVAGVGPRGPDFDCPVGRIAAGGRAADPRRHAARRHG